ncbi:MAG: heparinase II/III family protein [Chloroflexales bacterium]|nr:heparinase II/III family protein [Chloroflexales bacterium]
MIPTFDSETIAAILREAKGHPPFPTHADRHAWERLRGQRIPQHILAWAEQALHEPTPQALATDYLAFQRDGQREPYEKPIDRRRERLIMFTLAECLEGKGRFADAILNDGWAICEESTWVVPAHGKDYPYILPDPQIPLIDLWSAITSFTLAEVDYLLGDALHPALRSRIRHEVRRRSTDAFLERNDYLWLGYGKKKINNWMPVCAGGTAGAALYLECDLDRLAAVLAKAIDGMQRYLATFGGDGACAEGVGYWEKGMFFFVALADLIATQTEGRIDLFDDPRLRQIAAFPMRVELSPGCFVAFSDTGVNRQPQWALLHFLAGRYDLPALAALDPVGSQRRTLTGRGPGEKIRDLFWYPDESANAQPPMEKNKADFFSDVQWLIARATPADSNGLVLAVKGGHNDEPHNHNDVGSFIVHWRGESLLAELGAMRYNRDSFKADLRYTFLANRSLGHSVPYVNGCEQGTGQTFRADNVRYVMDAERDCLELDLAAAYPPEADLARLGRRVALVRSTPTGWVELTDTVVFRSQPGSYACVLISFAAVAEEEPGQLVISGAVGKLLINYDAQHLYATVETIPDVDLRGGPRPVRRIKLEPHMPVQKMQLVLQITPLP